MERGAGFKRFLIVDHDQSPHFDDTIGTLVHKTKQK
jgi:hypothetical protein